MNDDTSRQHHRGRQIAIALGGGAALVAAIVMINFHGSDDAPKAKEFVPVSVAQVSIRDVETWKLGVGAVEPIESVDVKARVDGQIVRILFREGDVVAKGQPLAQIDPRPYKALYDQARANRDRDAAQLANLRLDLDRAVKLAALGAGTSQNVDTLKAQVAAQRAIVAADQAQIDTARLNYDWTTVRSPIAGRIGLRQVNLGATVRQNDATGIVTVTQITPIAAVFTLPQDALPAITGIGKAAEVVLSDQAGAAELARGQLVSIDSKVDLDSGQVRVKANFANGNGRLWPGTLVSARLRTGVVQQAVTVPASAIQTSQTGPFIYVLKPGNTVDARPVRTGDTIDGITLILGGIAKGETVVTSGQSRIAKGSQVAPRRAGQ